MVEFSKRLQVFVSSTYLDLIEERQAAVQAILEAKHIPAGMELFTAGDQSQWEVIKHWIDQSDVYLLILGGRYGSIDKETGKSYTHLEYEYALKQSIPVFSCVLRDPDKRAMDKGDINKYLERENPAQYKDFKNLVQSKIVKYWENSEQIKTSIILTLNEFEKRNNLIGWVRSNQQINSTLIEEEKTKLEQEMKKNYNNQIKELEADYNNKVEELNQFYKNRLKEQEVKEQLSNNRFSEIRASYQQEKQKLEQSFKSQINQLQQQLATADKSSSEQKIQLKSYQQQLNEKESIINQLQEKIQKLESNVSKPILSTNSTEIELKSEKGVDYTTLRELLAAGKWKEADLETSNVMLQAANRVSKGWLNVEEIDNFPCDDLRTIDQLWVHYSKGKFGFSVQKKIYVDELGGTRDYNKKIWYEFCAPRSGSLRDRVGWRKGGDYVSYSDLTFELQDTTHGVGSGMKRIS